MPTHNKTKKNQKKNQKLNVNVSSNCPTHTKPPHQPICLHTSDTSDTSDTTDLHDLISALDERDYKQARMEPISARRLVAYLDQQYIYSGLTAYNPVWSVGYAIKKSEIIKKHVTISAKINTLKDLIDLLDKYPLSENIEYSTDLSSLHAVKPLLHKLNEMIGMNDLKRNIMDQIIYYAQGLHKTGNSVGDYMHTVIYGPPGTGKTEIAKIIGSIFAGLGILKKGSFKKVTRSDLIAGYLGQTALKTMDVIREAEGGVLFIDEAYALGNSEKKDSFAKECIDTLCEALSDKKKDIMVIVAGYEKELKSCFFDYNTGLESRFTWRFKTDAYAAGELKQIFFKLIDDNGWKYDTKSIKDAWFEARINTFKHFGRDMENLFTKTKIAHSRRVFCDEKKYQKGFIDLNDLNGGFEVFEQNLEQTKSQICHISTMYV